MRIDWVTWQQVGLRDLRLSPEVFWALTPAELMLIAGVVTPDKRMSQDRLRDLMTAFPDTEKKQ